MKTSTRIAEIRDALEKRKKLIAYNAVAVTQAEIQLIQTEALVSIANSLSAINDRWGRYKATNPFK